MTIEVPAVELYAVAATLRAGSERAVDARVWLDAPVDVGGDVQAGVASFAETARIAVVAVGGELDWLGRVLVQTADSWLGLDGSLLPVRGEVLAR